jgi:hypothetical protein
MRRVEPTGPLTGCIIAIPLGLAAWAVLAGAIVLVTALVGA